MLAAPGVMIERRRWPTSNSAIIELLLIPARVNSKQNKARATALAYVRECVVLSSAHGPNIGLFY